MKRFRAFLCICAVLVLAAACLPITAAAASETVLDGGERQEDVTVYPGDPLLVASAENAGVPAAANAAAPVSAAAQPPWALLNLILALLTVASAIALSLGLVGGGGSRLRGVLRTLTLLPAALSAGLFLLTQNLSRGMAFTDRWTVWLLATALLQGVLLVLLAIKPTAQDGDAD